MRNLILMHLESLNNVNYQVNKNMFPNLAFWEKESLVFPDYFSTATSTLMILGDLLYGGMRQYEVCDSMDCIPGQYCYKESLFDSLRKKGYVTGVLYYPGGADCESANRRHVAGFQNQLKSFREYSDYIFEAERIMDSEKPFALMCCNTISNVALNHHIPYGKLKSGLDRWKDGYQFMDSCVGEISRLLKSKNLLDNTTIIFYGDHGDDYYAHGTHGGLTHAIEPYASLIHTPFWIYDNRLVRRKKCNDLISTIDIRDITERLLSMPETKFEWNELGLIPRKYAFARNAYAAQPVRKGIFNKGYCLTDGKFLFLASNNGLELYDIEMDRLCQNNLLYFFKYKEGILHLNSELNASLGYHYRHIFDIAAVRQIRQIFYYFRKKLYDEVTELYRYAGCKDKINELNFEDIHDI